MVVFLHNAPISYPRASHLGINHLLLPWEHKASTFFFFF